MLGNLIVRQFSVNLNELPSLIQIGLPSSGHWIALYEKAGSTLVRLFFGRGG
jgi:hypothetical protein